LSPSRWAANITLGELGVAGMAARSSVTSQLSTRFEVLTQYLFFASIDTVHLPGPTRSKEREGHGVASVRKVVVYEFMTLDGVAENIAGFFTEWDDDEVDAAGAAVIATQDAVILVRRSYDEWAPFWPRPQ
jgi:hypothetical protein